MSEFYMGVSETDFDFLRRLSSLYQALCISATNPIVIDVGEMEDKVVGMFYDAYGDGDIEDLKIAEEIMRKRIEIAGYDIKKHHKYHSEFLKSFYSVDEYINTNNRMDVAETSRDLCGIVKDYVLNLIDPHTERFGEDAFLHYPFCEDRFSFYIPGTKVVGDLVFNLNATSSGAENYLRRIIRRSKDFELLEEKIPIDKIATSEDMGEGIMDTSLRGRHELNKELLKRIGFDV